MRVAFTILLAVAVLLPACGPDDGASIAVRIRMAPVETDGLRGFTPENPPEWVYAAVVRTSDLAEEGGAFKAVAEMDEAWDEMETDPLTGRRLMLLNVKPNAGKADPYLLQVESQVTDPLGRRVVDACGVVGGIQTTKGEKKAVDLVAHTESCGLVCADDARCVGPRWCLGFECQDEKSCASDDVCPMGAWCDTDRCTGRCGDGLPDCRSDQETGEVFVCCQGICARSCAP
jgi:hypothetical protein